MKKKKSIREKRNDFQTQPTMCKMLFGLICNVLCAIPASLMVLNVSITANISVVVH